MVDGQDRDQDYRLYASLTMKDQEASNHFGTMCNIYVIYPQLIMLGTLYIFLGINHVMVRGGVKKKIGTFGWCPPQSGDPPPLPQLW